jgi:hypothetical protein
MLHKYVNCRYFGCGLFYGAFGSLVYKTSNASMTDIRTTAQNMEEKQP